MNEQEIRTPIKRKVDTLRYIFLILLLLCLSKTSPEERPNKNSTDSSYGNRDEPNEMMKSYKYNPLRSKQGDPNVKYRLDHKWRNRRKDELNSSRYSAKILTDFSPRKTRNTKNFGLNSKYEMQDDDPSVNICLPKSDKPDKVIDIAVLVPTQEPEHYTPCSRDQVMPTVQLAVKHLKASELRGPLRGWNINVHYRDTNCSSTLGPLAAVDLHFKGKADVFLGPVCEYALAPVVRFASVWDTPVLTPGGHPHAFDFKENFPSLTRLRGFDTEVSQVFKSIAQHFGWNLIGLLYEDTSDSEGHSACHLTLSGVHDAFNKTSENRGFVQGVDDLTEVITYFSDKARIIVVCAQNASIVREILLIAHDLGMTNGEFVFFNIQLFARNQTNYRPWFDPADTVTRNRVAREAFSSLFTITARLPDDPGYRNFTQEVHSIALEMFNVSYPDEEVFLSPYVASFYEAVIVYTRALNSTLANRSLITNGTEIRKHLWNHTFTGLTTGNVSINANGDRNAAYAILDLNETDDESGYFTVVGVYMGEELNITNDIFWPGDGPPKDRPQCGFRGEYCHSYVFLLVVSVLCLLVVILLGFSVFIYRRLRRLTRGMDTLTTAVGEEDALQMVSLHKQK